MSAKLESGASGWTDPDDAPELDDAFFDGGVYEVGGQRVEPPRKGGRPRSERPKVHTGLRLDADVLDFFKAAGQGWQTRINAALRHVMEEGASRR